MVNAIRKYQYVLRFCTLFGPKPSFLLTAANKNTPFLKIAPSDLNAYETQTIV